MPRRPRIHLDGVPIHIVQRGHNREPCFFGEDDYKVVKWGQTPFKGQQLKIRGALGYLLLPRIWREQT
jgi:hypothetical protein